MRAYKMVVFWVVSIGSFLYSQGAKPNILFLFSDDHAYQAIGAYESRLKDYTQTPHLDQLAEKGMLFKRAYVTNSICGPSRAVIQTGKYSHVNGFKKNGNKFNGNQQTFPKILRANGYETALVGKWHLGTAPQGFDYYEALPGQGRYYQPQFYQVNQYGGTKKTYQGYSADVVADRALNWLDSARNETKPFMLMVQFKATHRTWMPPMRYLEWYDENDSIPEPKSLLEDFRDDSLYRGSASYHANMRLGNKASGGAFLDGGYDDKRAFTHGVFNSMNGSQKSAYQNYYGPGNTAFNSLTDPIEKRRWWYQRYIKDYLKTGRSIDDNVGRLIKYLKDNNMDSNTVVIYSSDQGFYLGEHGWFDKRMAYEQSMRTPLIVKWPGVVAEGVVNNQHIVSNVDFAETFIDIAGVSVPSDMQGASLLPILKNEIPNSWRKTFYYQYFEGGTEHNAYEHYAVTNGRYKLIHFHGIDEWEFYDLARDPDETRNQYYIPENDSIIQSLKTTIQQHQSTLGVQASDINNVSRTKRTFSKQLTQLPIVDSSFITGGIAVPTSIQGVEQTVLFSTEKNKLFVSSEKVNMQVKLVNSLGRVVYENKYKGIAEINTSRFQTGLYVLQVSVEKSTPQVFKVRI